MKANLEMSSSKPVCSLDALIRNSISKDGVLRVTYDGKNLESNRSWDFGDG